AEDRRGAAPDLHGVGRLVGVAAGKENVGDAQIRTHGFAHGDKVVLKNAHAVDGDQHDGDAVVAQGDCAGPGRVVHAFGRAVGVEARHPHGVELAIAIPVFVGVDVFVVLVVLVHIDPGVVLGEVRADIFHAHTHLQALGRGAHVLGQ